MSGQLLGRWLPFGLVRRLIFFGLIAIGVLGIYFTQNYFFLLALVLAGLMSPS
jgi:hypothetical protein